MVSQREYDKIKVFFVPIIWKGHMIPMLDLARLFAEKGANVTIFIVQSSSVDTEDLINRVIRLQMKFHLLHVPEGGEDIAIDLSRKVFLNIFEAWKLLQDQVEEVVSKELPNCIVFDMFLPWTADIAEKFNIPSLLFTGGCIFSSCVLDSLYHYKPYENVNDSESFIVPGLPHQLELTRSQLPDFMKRSTELDAMFAKMRESNQKTHGFLVNTFHKLESDYADHYKKITGKKIWHVGPVSLCNRVFSEKAERGRKAAISEHECLKWLDSKAPKSVIYICFGSMGGFDSDQLSEIAQALESSVFSFLWVIGKSREESLPFGFEDRMMGEKGLIIKGWAPQILILDHPSIGGFVTHCGWNSVLEGISTGVPMITWPLFAEQFTNEKLVTVVLKIGVPVGSKEWKMWGDEREVISKEEISKAINRVMGDGEEAKEMREKVQELRLAAKQSMEAGGSSKTELENLLQLISQWTQH